MSPLHKATKRDYLARVNGVEFPKHKAAELAKKWGFEYWDGDRRINYGGYKYITDRWLPVIKKFQDIYKLRDNAKILDIGCGKGFLLYDFKKYLTKSEVYGIDVSDYALENSKEEVKNNLVLGSATSLPWPDGFFDLVVSINTLHNLHCYDLELALKEIQRVGKESKYICVESYKTELQKMNLLYWQVTCESFYNPEEWAWWFEKTGYTGDHSFIYFD